MWGTEEFSILSFWFVTEMAHCERCTKQAAAFKINKVIENAIGHHEGAMVEKASNWINAVSSTSSRSNTAFGTALLNFQAMAHCRELSGGIVFSFKKIFDGSILNEEGVWIHSHLYAMNLSQ